MREEARDIENLSSSNEEVARDAFDRLRAQIETDLNSFLYRFVPDNTNREDIIEEALTRIWDARLRFEYRGFNRWMAFIKQVARNCLYDFIRKNPRTESLTQFHENESSHTEFEDFFYGEAKQLYKLADEVWLGFDEEVSVADRNRRVLAAQLFYLHSKDWKLIARTVRLDPELDRDRFDAWLDESSTLTKMFFHEIHASNHRLCGYLLNPQKPLSSDELDSVCRFVFDDSKQTGPETIWTREESAIILLRFRYGFTNSQVASRLSKLSRELIDKTVDRCLGMLPFRACVVRVKKAPLPNHAYKLFKDRKLWKRIIFQYLSSNQIPLDQILERIVPPAEECQVRINGNTLQALSGSKRLLHELQKASDRREKRKKSGVA